MAQNQTLLRNLAGPWFRRIIFGLIVAGLALATVGRQAHAQTQTVAQLVAEGFQVLAFTPIQGGYAALLANYRGETPVMLLCNMNLNDQAKVATSVCFEVL